jgi:hypothetical protein
MADGRGEGDPPFAQKDRLEDEDVRQVHAALERIVHGEHVARGDVVLELGDHYDQRGELWRVSEAHTINYYEVPTYWSTIETHMDLQSGRYVATGLDNQDPVNTFNVPLSPSSYTPQALRTRGRR